MNNNNNNNNNNHDGLAAAADGGGDSQPVSFEEDENEDGYEDLPVVSPDVDVALNQTVSNQAILEGVVQGVVARALESAMAEVKIELSGVKSELSAQKIELDLLKGRQSAVKIELDLLKGRQSAVKIELDLLKGRESAMAGVKIELDLLKGRVTTLETGISGILKALAPAVTYSLLETAVYLVMLKHNHVHTTKKNGTYGPLSPSNKTMVGQKVVSFANWALAEMLGMNRNGESWTKMPALKDNKILCQEGMSGLKLFLECSTTEVFKEWLIAWPPKPNIISHGHQFLLALGHINQSIIDPLGPAAPLSTMDPLSKEQVAAAVAAMVSAHDGVDADYFIAGEVVVDECCAILNPELLSRGLPVVDDAKVNKVKRMLR